MLEKLLLVEDGKGYQFGEERELVKYLLGKNYYELTKKEQMKQMTMNAFFKCAGTGMEVKKIPKKGNITQPLSVKNQFVVHDEKTYVLSLLLTNRATLLESTDSNIFTDGLDKSKIDKNYIIVNKFAEELLGKYVNQIIAKREKELEERE